MANENLNPHTFHEGCLKRLRSAERELERVEKRVKTLATKQDDIRQKRESLTEQITEHERTLAGLQGQRADLQGGWASATFDNDTGTMDSIQKRRTELDKCITEQKKDIRRLRSSLDGLEDTTREAAELQVRLEQLNYGNAYIFASELRTVLVRHESSLKSRQSDAERALPSVDLNTLEAVRDELVEGYAEEKQRQQEAVGRAQMKRARQEQELKQRVNTPYVGWSGYVDQYGEKLPRGSVDADGTVKREFQNKQGTRRAMPKNRTVEVVS